MKKTKYILPVVLLVAFVCAPFSVADAALIIATKSKTQTKTQKTEVTSDEPWLLTYYVGYQNDYLKPKDIDYTLMTHIVVGGVGVNADGTLNEHWHLTDGDGREMALDVGKRADKKGVKKLIWLGGPNEQDKFYSATLDVNRKTFVKNIVELLGELDYDGVDIDWEPIRAQDKAGVLALVKDLRKADPDIIITVPVNWVESNVQRDLTLYAELSKYVDKMFIMSYSMSGAWSGWESWHGAALEGESATTPSSIESSVNAYLEDGVPEEKLGVGIGTYATCWEYPVTKPGQTLPAGFTSKDIHVMSMRTMMEDYYNRRKVKWDSDAQASYLSFTKPQGDFQCGFISYETERSVEEKVAYVKDEGLGGVLVWNIGTGYYPENTRSKRHELLKSIWKALTD